MSSASPPLDQPRSQLLDGPAWAKAKDAVLTSLALPEDNPTDLRKYFGSKKDVTWLNMMNDPPGWPLPPARPL